MSLKEQLRADLTAAMKARDELVSSTIRMTLAAITTEEVAGKVARELSDAEVVAVISKEAKKRREAATAFEDAGRAELADKERAEGEVLARYLPQPLTDAELEEIVDAEVAAASAAGASGQSAMGAVMKAVQARVAGRADGGAVAALVRAKLAN
ncbi:MAG: GatB/YqeY domain-containing protein [Actinomycetales bacterium]|nr:GatB/YqeY domain-containing protein [Actinomycetales bacterium]